MEKNQALAAAKAFNVKDAELSLWVFKKSEAKRFTAKSVNLAPSLEAELRNIAASSLGRVTEVDDYQILADTNEVSCLHLESDETHFGELQSLVDRPPQENLIAKIKQLDNSIGYLIRLHHQGSVMYFVRKVESDWKTKKCTSVINTILTANELQLIEDRSLTISKFIDFIVFGEDILVMRKAAFESLLSYKAAFAQSFHELRQDAAFSSIFSDLTPLEEHVGQNAMHLRRMAAIRQKGHYADPAYVDRLKNISQSKGWGIQFDEAGRICVTPETARAVMQVLLNHRLHSELSLSDFDVQSASAVQ